MALKIVRDANKNRALLEPFAPFTRYSRQDLDLDLRVLSNDGSDAALVRQAFNLTKSNMKLAFAHFRFEVEADEPTLYVYDIQISPQAQRRGLGRFLMQLIELIAWRVGMTNVMLTVFEGNQGGRRLYEALGYVKSIDSPDYGVERSDKGYSILRKQKPLPRNKA
ncbi:hypothetical protein H632_c2434p0 [Helicosporidium sp. ATCC 50920]|nr:hypothetical protein H632_c2434p0 [Helicosporidium sp. ATCC 50920]|eukprot:KDD73199.1 hypothetical protein H632_c2434p0 [Helicosporidium sp. ATCC 50920]